MNEEDLITVYVYPDGENYEEPPSWKSDDYFIRQTSICTVCDTVLDLEYEGPFGSCKCGTTEWYY